MGISAWSCGPWQTELSSRAIEVGSITLHADQAAFSLWVASTRAQGSPLTRLWNLWMYCFGNCSGSYSRTHQRYPPPAAHKLHSKTHDSYIGFKPRLDFVFGHSANIISPFSLIAKKIIRV